MQSVCVYLSGVYIGGFLTNTTMRSKVLEQAHNETEASIHAPQDYNLQTSNLMLRFDYCLAKIRFQS